MTITDVKNFSPQQVQDLSRSELFDVFKLIMPRGALKELALDFGYSGIQPQTAIWRICKGEGSTKRNKDEVLEHMREKISEYINKNKISNTVEVPVLVEK